MMIKKLKFYGSIVFPAFFGPDLNQETEWAPNKLEASDDEAAVGCARDEIYKLLFSSDEINSR